MAAHLNLTLLDWGIITAILSFSLIVGFINTKRAGKSVGEFFVSGKKMPWWLLGVSMVATTFSADTPNLVTDIVRKHGVSGNWVWWAFLLTGMLTVFVYARLWRRSAVTTDLEFYELRYGGKPAALLRGFRALYLGVFFNVVIMASVSLAAIKIGGIMGFTPLSTLFIATATTVVYTSLGGLRSVLITDFFQFLIAMVGTVCAAVFLLNIPEIGGLSNLLTKPVVVERLSLLPDFSDPSTLVPLFILPLAIQWWSVWYPGSEPGGGGYIAQRMLSAKDEKNALMASLIFNIAHYALRPWPWILIALGSLLIFPDITSLQASFPDISADKVDDDLAYPAMLTFLPSGLLGMVIASLIAAYMSTFSTHLNWGSSYIVYDFYKRFLKPHASEKELVIVGRVSIVLLAIVAALLALSLKHALQVFSILLQIGAGTGLIFILRWFWWRINAYTEIAGMVVSFFVALYFEIIHPVFFTPLETHWKLLLGVGITTSGWILVTLVTRPENNDTLKRFCEKIKPAPYGWKSVLKKNPELTIGQGRLTTEILFMVVGAFTIYGALFTTGYLIYGHSLLAIVIGLATAGGLFFMIKNWHKLNLP